jgi:hypothetical protein
MKTPFSGTTQTMNYVKVAVFRKLEASSPEGRLDGS